MDVEIATANIALSTISGLPDIAASILLIGL
jgi:hypothetical protein